MSLKEANLLLGSDLGNRKDNLEIAKSFISKELGEIKKETEILKTEAIGFTSELNFLNQGVKILTELSPYQLLKKIKNIEKKMGRTYEILKPNDNYSSRIIDIDILTYYNTTIESAKLTIPHKQLETREFAVFIHKKLT